MVRPFHNTPIPLTPTRTSDYSSNTPKCIGEKSDVRVVVRIRPLNKNEAKDAPIIYPIENEKETMPQEPPTPGSPVSEQSLSSVGHSVLSTTSSQRSFSFRKPKVLQKIMSKHRELKKAKNASSGEVNTTKISNPAKALITPTTIAESNREQLATSKKVFPTSCWASDRIFDFDAVYGPSVTQEEFYQNCFGDSFLSSDLMEKGYNTTIIAYGMTGAGKSFTMSNVDGVIYHAVNDLFRDKDESKKDVFVKLSCFEIYVEEVRDLLSHDNNEPNTALKIRDNGENVAVIGLSEISVEHVDQVRELLDHAQKRRTTSRTCSNARSSRSHAVYNLTIQSSAKLASKHMMTKLTFVDLAGSERIKVSGVIGNQRKESIHINKDLFALSKVISSLHNQTGHVPYRDSKLTRLLRESLGGNCRTILIACISPAKIHADESLNTLRYAERAKSISNSISANFSKSDSSVAMTPTQIASIQEENRVLRARLTNMASMETMRNSIDVSGLQKKVQLAREEATATRLSCHEVTNTAERLRERLNIFHHKGKMGQRRIPEKMQHQELEAMCASLRQEIDFVNSENDILRHQNIRLQDEIQRLRTNAGSSEDIEQLDIQNTEEGGTWAHKKFMSSKHKKFRSHAEKLLNWAGKAIQSQNEGALKNTCNSTNTSEGTNLRPTLQNETCAVFRARNNAENRENEFYISNIHNIKHSAICPCQDSLVFKQTGVADFYLPKLGMICTCGLKDEVPLVNNDPYHLENILRDWQIEFLKTHNIHTAVDLLHSYTQDSNLLAKSMRDWRKQKGMMSIKTKSCRIALRIWARTCKVVIQMEQSTKAGDAATRADFLNISLASDVTSISTLGFQSSYTDP